MKAQEIYEREGFLCMDSPNKLNLPAVVTNQAETIVPKGTLLVAFEEISAAEFRRYAERNGLMIVARPEPCYYYKVVAE